MGYKKGTFNHSEESKKKISETMKRRLKNKEFTNAFCKGNVPWNKGKPMNDKTRKKLSDISKRIWKDEKMRDKYVKSHIGLKNSEESKKKVSIASKKWHKENKNTEKYKERVEKMKKGINLYFKNNPQVRKILSERMKKLNKDPNFRLKGLYANKNTKPNKPETILINIFKKYNFTFEYVGNSSFWITENNKNFNPDFIDKKNKLIIEMFGVYWHNRDGVVENDKLRLKAYKNRGYKSLVIWDYELDNEINVKNKIENFCKK